MIHSALFCLVATLTSAKAFTPHAVPRFATRTSLAIGMIDSLSNFLRSRDNDFIKLEETQVSGPGPLLVLYKVPAGIADDEITDMLSDSAPLACRKGVRLARITNEQDELLKVAMEEALSTLMEGKTEMNAVAPLSRGGCPLLFFSGFENKEMMETYNIVAKEIYAETGQAAACAKAVPNAMSKPLGQVFDEILGDHQDAMSSEESQ